MDLIAIVMIFFYKKKEQTEGCRVCSIYGSTEQFSVHSEFLNVASAQNKPTLRKLLTHICIIK